MMRKIHRFSVSLLMTALLGCSGSVNQQTADQEEQILITSANISRITGMQWTLQKMRVDGSGYPLAGEMPFIKLETGVGGSS